MCIRILFFIFILSVNSCKKTSKSKGSQTEFLCESIVLVEEYLNGKEVNVLELEKCCDLLEKYTGINSEYDASPLGLKYPSKDNLIDWKKKLKQNKVICTVSL